MKNYQIKLVLLIAFVVFNSSLFAQIDIESKIKEKLPNNVFLREFEKIPDTKRESYVGIYIENFVIANVPNISNDPMGGELGFYYTCPEQTLGQTISGIYHLFLFQDNSIKSDVIIPPAYPENSSNEQELCYQNTEYNLCWHFEDKNNCDRISESNNSTTNLRKAKLIDFKDCTGSGKKHDFVLVGETEACGWVCYLVAGYNEELNKIEIFDIKNPFGISQWFARFYPDEQGDAIIEILCGDHGFETYTRETYKFNKENRRYELIDIIETPCE
ncbi:MAG TPA: hypothetical protein VIL99_09480 [Ignavibacteria bacterium]